MQGYNIVTCCVLTNCNCRSENAELSDADPHATQKHGNKRLEMLQTLVEVSRPRPDHTADLGEKLIVRLFVGKLRMAPALATVLASIVWWPGPVIGQFQKDQTASLRIQ